ncbi:MAG TPA: hypothetical protein VFK52_12425 [Nocardioidaceae bacterium]|nr:hypothetical protein [Nocardioidaceae bacterium]
MNANSRTRVRSRGMAATAVGILAIALPGPAVAAADDAIDVVNTETVQVYTDATGAVKTKRIYEQLALTGTGSAHIENPAVVEGLRNLQGFGGFGVNGDKQVVDLEVDGRANLRSVSDYEGDLPLEIEVAYTLDGDPIDPADVVGRSGRLEATFTVKNVSKVHQDISYDDGTGRTITKPADVPVPMVGSLTTVLPPAFRDVASKQANMAGDGRGNTKLSFTMTLIPPIGSDSATFGYTATIDDAVVPRATVTALPVNPLKSPSFKSAGKSYRGGAQTGADLADGALQIDSNLLKLRDGAGDLLAGLIQLRDGATQLSAGLTDEAAPGAGAAAVGATKLRDGLTKIDDGAGALADGSAKLAGGSTAAADGSRSLAEGLGKIAGGLDQLAAVDGLPAAADGIKQLQAGVKVIVAGFGTTSDPESLLGGLAALEGGLGSLLTGSGALVGGLTQLGAGLPTAKGGVDQVKAGLDAAVVDGGSLDQLIGGLTSLTQLASCGADPVCTGTVAALIQGAQASKSNLTAAAAGLGQVSAGLATAVAALTQQILPGAQQIEGGLASAKAGATKLSGGAALLKGGVLQVSGGLDQLSIGVTKAVAGVLQLSAGATSAQGGATALASGLGTLEDGAETLADGAARLAGGTGDAAAGSSELADGLGDLADGLGDAAVGSQKISGGLSEAADGVPKLEDGAQRLSTEGSQELVKAGKDTAQEYGELYAVLKAGAVRAESEKMVVGAPAGATGLSAYTFEILGEKGESGRNLVRALIGLGLAVVAGAVLFARRRLTSS